ncbi:unnamed protein product [Spirodela intermedia]|uniref:Uncharacterized protein n=1 Tax=Spirodela intermedia TaxID=51605 RepID=A0A7I8LCQ2_SPIIN|nr:unnamed protein product [Spirodela intermedia]
MAAGKGKPVQWRSLIVVALVLLLHLRCVDSRLLSSPSPADYGGYNGGDEAAYVSTPQRSHPAAGNGRVRHASPALASLLQLLRSGPSRKGSGH